MEKIKLPKANIELCYNYMKKSDKTLVFIHGNSSCKEAFKEQFSHFSNSNYSLLTFDLPGHGEGENSSAPEITYNMPSYAEITKELIHALGIKDHIVIGWSLGGNTALEMAGQDIANENPNFKGILIFGAPPVGPGTENIEKAYLPATFTSAVGEANPTQEMINNYVQMVYGTLSPLPDELIKAAMRADGKAREFMVNHWMGGVGGHKQIETIANWKKPIAVIHGNQDPFVSLEYLKTVNWQNLWKKQVFEMEDCSHAPFIENPNVFNNYLSDFASDVF